MVDSTTPRPQVTPATRRRVATVGTRTCHPHALRPPAAPGLVAPAPATTDLAKSTISASALEEPLESQVLRRTALDVLELVHLVARAGVDQQRVLDLAPEVELIGRDDADEVVRVPGLEGEP